VRALQKRQLEPVLRRLLKMLFLSKKGPTKGKEPDDWDVCFNPLWQLSDTEKADVFLKRSQGLSALVAANIILPEEAASQLAADREIVVDLDARQKLMEEHQAAVDEAKATQADPETGKPLPQTPPTNKPPAPFGD
jgi:hypothetical protein